MFRYHLVLGGVLLGAVMLLGANSPLRISAEDFVASVAKAARCPESNNFYPDLAEWQVRRDQGLPADYIPANLVSITTKVRSTGPVCVTRETAAALEGLFSAATKEGLYLAVTSGYRAPEEQKKLYEYWIATEGERARREVALPYYSEHQLGTAIDLTGTAVGFRSVAPEFAVTADGAWLNHNAHRWGFALSYPNREGEYTFEPWHWRYIGVDIATTLYNRGLSFIEHSTTTRTLLF